MQLVREPVDGSGCNTGLIPIVQDSGAKVKRVRPLFGHWRFSSRKMTEQNSQKSEQMDSR